MLEYENEGTGPYLADLSHCQRWDIQDRSLDQIEMPGLSIPRASGDSRIVDGVLVSRMNRTQASVWHLPARPVQPVDFDGLTEVTEATVSFGLFGAGVLSIAETLSKLDLDDPERTTPFLIQGPLSGVACQIVMMDRSGPTAGCLLSCARGYGRDMQQALMRAGKDHCLRPAGENTFHTWLATVCGRITL